MHEYKTLMYTSYDGLVLYFYGTCDELQELNGKTFPAGTILNIVEKDTERTKIFATVNQEPIEYDSIPYNETIRTATTEDTNKLHDRISKLEDRVAKLESTIVTMINTQVYIANSENQQISTTTSTHT